MKQTYKSGSLVALATVVVSLFYIFADHPWDAQSKQKQVIEKIRQDKVSASGLPENTISQLQQGLEKREYYISYDEKKQSLQSPNRKQNLRAYYKAGELTIQNRIDSAGHNFHLTLNTEGVFADGRKLYTPEANAAIENIGSQLDIRSQGFTEQYINTETGIRQNFIIEDAPRNTKELQVRLSVEGLKVNDQHNNELHFYSENLAGVVQKQLVYNGLKCWDSQGRALEATLAYQNELILINVDVANAAYPVTIDPIIANGNPGNANNTVESNQTGAYMGNTVSSAGDVNGDGYSDVLVGAYLYDKGETNEGAVFVYHGSATGISSNPAIILEGNQVEAQFGTKVATAGDVNKDGYSDVIIGAPLYDKGQTNEGAALIYHGSGGGLNANAALILEGNQVEARYGQSVNTAGDVNGDGYSDVVIGANLYDLGQNNEGLAVIHHGSASGVSANVSTILESNQAGAQLGFSVASAGDVNGDGYSDILVGIPYYDKGQVDEGMVNVYHGSALGLNVNPVRSYESDQATAFLGWAVSSAGDVNGDGYSDVLVGAPIYDKGETNEGAAFLYSGSAAGLGLQSSLILESNQAEAQLGIALAAAGDVNGDGYGDVIIGAYLYDKGESNEGAAFVYQGSGQGLLATPASTLEGNQNESKLGVAVASAGDVNGDGYSDVVTGAFLYDKGEADEGAAFVWMGSADGVTLNSVITMEGKQNGSQFGRYIANSGDVNGDGFSDLILSASTFDNGQVREGAVFVFHGTSTGVSTTPAVMLEVNQDYANMGTVSFAGDVNGDGYDDIVVGVPLYGELNFGAVFVYHGSPQGIVNTVKAKLESKQEEDGQFGKSVASAGDVNGDGYSDIIVGAPGLDVSQTDFDEGIVYIYHGSAAGLNTTPATTINGSAIGFFMGLSVDGAGDLNGDGFGDIVIGSPFYSDGQVYEGAAFVHYGSAIGIKKTADVTLQSNKADVLLGSVAGAGDINGDGFSDLVVGVEKFSSGEDEEGAFYTYYGSQSGININPTIVESNKAFSHFGTKVSSAGDVNGDGYGDIIVGAPDFSGGETLEGAFFVYIGSSSGIIPGYTLKLESNQENAFLGNSVCGGGDFNGDGYSDLVSGAHLFRNQQQYAVGMINICYGGKNTSLKNNFRLYNSDLTSPINHNQFIQNNFGAGLYAKSFLGTNKGKLMWETKPKGQGFSKGADNIITHSTQSSGAQNVYTNLGLTGTELKSVVAKQGPATKVRVRVKYDPVLALTGQTYGPWRYLPAYLLGNSVAPVPEEAMTETIKKKVTGPELSDYHIEVFPNPASEKIIVKHNDPEKMKSLQLFTTLGKSVYKSEVVGSEVDIRNLATGVYILVVTHADGSQKSQKVIVKK